MGPLEAIKKGFGTTNNLIALISIVVVFNFISSIIMLAVIGTNPNPERIAQVAVGLIGLFLGIMLLWMLLEGGFISSVISKIKTDEAQIESFLNNGLKFFLRLWLLSLLASAIIFLVLILAGILSGIFFAMGGGKNPFFNAIGVIIFLIFMIGLIPVSLPLLISRFILVAEDNKVIASLKAGVGLFKMYWGRIVCLFLLILSITIGVSIIVNLIVFLLSKIIPAGWLFATINTLLMAVVNGYMAVFGACSIAGLILSLLAQPKAATDTGVVQ